MYTYLILELATLLVPLLYTYEKNLGFYKRLRPTVVSILIVASVFSIWDIVFTEKGVWGFNATYHLPFKLFGLPIEEWLFFLVIPYASIFLHETVVFLLPKVRLNSKTTTIISVLIIIAAVFILASNIERAYSVVNSIFIIVVVFTVLFLRKEILQHYYISFLVILIPFIIVNGILTGNFIPDEVVWYNSAEIIGLRVFTIPAEDFGFAFSLILINLFLIKTFDQKHV